ncbi:MAG: DUF7680 family protein [Limnochordia bacterium]|jgi:hypothetical protein
MRNNTEVHNGAQPKYTKRVIAMTRVSPWVLRVTEHKGKPAPVFIIKERFLLDPQGQEENSKPPKPVLRDRGLIYGEALRRCLPVIRSIVGEVRDEAGIPLELQQFIPTGRITFRGNLPLDAEAGTKLALMFKLQERLENMDRVELIAWRVHRFTREEAEYWRTRSTQYGRTGNRWAIVGMRTMLGGQSGDPHIQQMLDRLKQ